MSDNNTIKQTNVIGNGPMSVLSFKNLRIWLVRRISGQNALDDLKEKKDLLVLHTVVDTMYKNLRVYVNETLHASVSKLTQEMLATIIANNVHLSDMQKMQIASILDTPSQSNNSGSYLG